ncbi:MAG: hypothetical protein ACREQY_10645 [Candidatus Binatia bacterium]
MVAPAAVVVLAQGQTDVTTDLPSGTWLLAVLAIGLALYLSYRLGARRSRGGAKRREGPVTKALSRQPTKRPPT